MSSGSDSSEAEAFDFIKAVESWNKNRVSNLVVPLMDDSVRSTKSKCGIRLSFGSISSFVLPSVFAGSSKTSKLEFCLHVSLFHAGSGSFFGNTWVSPLVSCKSSLIGKKSGVQLDLEGTSMFLCTQTVDPSCVAVVELVIVEKDSEGLKTLGQYGCGWGSLPVFSMIPDLTTKMSKRKIQVYSGSPRALLFIGSQQTETQLQLIPGCMVTFLTCLDRNITKVSHLIRLNEIIGPAQEFPGLKKNSKGKYALPVKVGRSVHLASTIDVYVNRVSILLPLNWETQMNEFISSQFGAKFSFMASFLLRVGAHNGRTVISTGCWTETTLKDREYSSHAEYDRKLSCDKCIRVKGVVKHPHVSLVCQLEYKVVSNNQTWYFAIGNSVWLPFSRAPKEIVFSNIKAKTAAVKLPLQMNLETQCSFTSAISYIQPDNVDGSAKTPTLIGLHLSLKPQSKLRGVSSSSESDENRESSNIKKKINSGESSSDSDASSSNSDPENLSESSSSSFEKEPRRRHNKLKSVSPTRRHRSIQEVQRTPVVTRQPMMGLDENILKRSLNLPIHSVNTVTGNFEMQSLTSTAKELNVTNPLSNSLSRASRTKLNTHGFDNVALQRRSVPDPENSALNVNMETCDRLKSNEITFQFAAFRYALDNNANRPSNVFFTYQFYNMKPTRTEKMNLMSEKHHKSKLSGFSDAFLLTRSDPKYRRSPSLALKYLVDTTTSDDKEPQRFAEYLYSESLFISVWDGDSMLQMGYAVVRLSDLMRQGEKSIKVAKEYDIVFDDSEAGVNGVQVMNVFRNCVSGGLVNGKIQIVLSNYGMNGLGRTSPEDQEEEQDWRIKTAFSELESSDEKKGPRYRVAAKPMSRNHPQLENLMKASASSDRLIQHRKGKRAKQEEILMLQNESSSMQSEWTFSENELGRLDRILDHQNHGFVTIPILSQYLELPRVENATGTLWAVLRNSNSITVDTFRLFNDLDETNSGNVSPAVFENILNNRLQLGISSDDIDTLISQFKHGSNGVGYEKFLSRILDDDFGELESKLRRILRKAEVSNGVSLENAFRNHFDANHDGTIERDEFVQGLKTLGLQISKLQVDGLMHRYGDGKVLVMRDFIALAERHERPIPKQTSSIQEKLKRVLEKARNKGVAFEDAFKHFDSNGDGKLSIQECTKGLKSIGMVVKSDEEMKDLFVTLDVDGDGFVEMDEFLKFLDQNACSEISPIEMKMHQVLLKAREKGMDIEKIFEHFDKDGNGEITFDECRQGLSEIGMKLTEEELQQLFHSWDMDHSGAVNMQEFVSFLSTKPKEPSFKKEPGSKKEPNVSTVGEKLKRVVLAAEKKGIAIRDTFDHFDRNGDGFISRDEFRKGLVDIGVEANQEDLNHMFSIFDINGDESVSLDKFLGFIHDKQGKEECVKKELTLDTFLKDNQEKIRQKCRSYDRNDDGTVSATRLEKILRGLGWDGDITELDEDRIDYEKLGTDFIRDKLKRAVSRAAKKGVDVKSLINSKDRSRSGKLSINDVHRLIVELGFSILEEPSGFEPEATSELRQVEKIKQLRRSRAIRSDKQGVYDIDEEDALLIRDSQLDVVRRYREGQKRAIINGLLKTSMTKHVSLFPSFAAPSFFETVLHNPYSYEERFKIEIGDSELRCITSGDEWRYYRDISQTVGGSPVEDEMITADTLELTLDADESVSIPFLFFSHLTEIKKRTIAVTFSGAKHGHKALVVQVALHPRHFIVDRTLYISTTANELCKMVIRTQERKHEPYLHCTNPSAIVQSLSPGEINFKYRALQSDDEFYILAYQDEYSAKLQFIWRIEIQIKQRLDFHGVLGQSTMKELIVKGDHFSRRVQVFTSCQGEAMLNPSGPFQLVAGAFNRVEVIYRPLTGNGNTRSINISMVDADSGELINSWIAKVTATLPPISRTFDLEMSLHEAAHKKVAYVNPWNEPRTFLVRTSDPTIVKAKQPTVEIPAKTKGFIRFWFAACHKPITREVLVFINDQEDQNEETLLIRAKFH